MKYKMLSSAMLFFVMFVLFLFEIPHGIQIVD